VTGASENQTGKRFFHSRVGVSPNIIAQEIGNEKVILDLKSDRYFGLDPTATRIWELLQQGENPQGILHIMTTEYDAAPEILESDLAGHLQALEKAGLITIID